MPTHVPPRRRAVVAATLAVIAGPARIAAQDPAAHASHAGRLQAALHAEVSANPSLPGELLHVYAPRLGLDTTLAAGVADRASGRPLAAAHVFRVASVTKTFTAAAVLRLVEDGRLGLDDPIRRHLPAATDSVLRAGGYRTDAITVRHLLTHTGGVYDYATDDRWYAAVLANPARRWTRAEQVGAAVAWGRPRFAPGAGFHYSDTGYILLGAILERVSGLPQARAYRALLGFDRLGLGATYLESLEPAPAGAGALAHPYLGDADAAGIDPSVDLYGGGGLVSSARDLGRFYRALLRGGVFRRPATLQTMLAVPATNSRPGGAYAMGIQQLTIGGQTCWGHNGFWGTAAHYCPAADVAVVRQINQAQPAPTFVARALYEQVAAVLRLGR